MRNGYQDPVDVVRTLAPRVAKIAGLVVLGLIVVFGSFYSVDSGHQGVVTRLGAVSRVTGPGGHFKLPLIEDVTEVGTRTQTLEWGIQKDGDGRMESYSHDQQPAHIGVKVVYNVKADEKSVTTLFTQYKNVDGYANAVIIPRALEAVKTVFGQYTAVRAIREREGFNGEVTSALHKLLDHEGAPVILESVQIQDITFSDAYEKAVEARMQAEVEVAKVTQNLERERKEAEIKVVQAEASAKAVRLAGEAEADAIRARSNALRDSPKLVELTIAEKWNGVLPTTMVPGTAVPFIGVK